MTRVGHAGKYCSHCRSRTTCGNDVRRRRCGHRKGTTDAAQVVRASACSKGSADDPFTIAVRGAGGTRRASCACRPRGSSRSCSACGTGSTCCAIRTVCAGRAGRTGSTSRACRTCRSRCAGCTRRPRNGTCCARRTGCTRRAGRTIQNCPAAGPGTRRLGAVKSAAGSVEIVITVISERIRRCTRAGKNRCAR